MNYKDFYQKSIENLPEEFWKEQAESNRMV
jgi:allophanate hydrolase subunit 2